MTQLADTVLARLVAAYGAEADAARAPAMSAYMRDQFPFLGIPTPRRRVLSRQVLAGLDLPAEADLREVALRCWALPEREYQYFATDYLHRHARRCGPDMMDTVRHLVVTKSWWDTVDALAAHVVGVLVQRHPALATMMDAWAAGEQMWLVRTALLHQLGYKERTDTERLFRYCRRQAGHPDFFIRKAIGWALREYAKTDPRTVRRFVQTHELAPLSAREALKNIAPIP